MAVEDEPGRDARVAAEAFDERGEDVGQLIARLELDGPQRLHQLPQRQHFGLQQVLHVAELRLHGRGGQRRLPSKRLDFHLDAEQRLDGAVVQLARDARALGRAAARLHLRLHVERVQHEPRLAHHRVEEAERACAAGGVQHEEAVGPFGAERA